MSQRPDSSKLVRFYDEHPINEDEILHKLRARGVEPASAELTMRPTTTVELEGKEAESMLRLADAIEDLDDVQHLHANFDIPEEEMARIA